MKNYIIKPDYRTYSNENMELIQINTYDVDSDKMGCTIPATFFEEMSNVSANYYSLWLNYDGGMFEDWLLKHKVKFDESYSNENHELFAIKIGKSTIYDLNKLFPGRDIKIKQAKELVKNLTAKKN